MYKFSKNSLKKLVGVDERLVEVMKETLSQSPYDFGITEGLRTIERQKQLVEEGKSQTMNSYHLKGKAVDICVYCGCNITWEHKYFKEVNDIVQRVAKEKGYKITWGGTFKTLVDCPHFQIEEV